MVGTYQAYQRATPGAGNAVQAAITQMWQNTAGQPPAARLAALGPAVDVYWTNTIAATGGIRLTQERTTRAQNWGVGGAEADEFPDLSDYSRHGWPAEVQYTHLITVEQARGYLTLLETVITPYLAETKYNKYNQTHKQACDAQGNIAAMRMALQTDASVCNNDGSFNTSHNHWQRIVANANFWTQERPRIAARAADVTALSTFTGPGSEQMFRLVTEGERNFVQQNPKTLAQGPSSYERHKWFFFRTGGPSVGHGYKFTINVKKGSIDMMLGRATLVSEDAQKTSPHAFLRKDNEPNCIGIHEELLETFCTHTVQSITCAVAANV